MGFEIEAFQNRFLAPGQARVDAILSVTAPTLANQTANSVATAAGPLAVGFILDKSGSMEGERLNAVKLAVTQAIDLLPPNAVFFVVAFDALAHVVVQPTEATPEAKRSAASKIQAVYSFGGTAMSRGLDAAKSMFLRCPNSIKQAIFLTDGKNESEQPSEVERQLTACEGLFQADCWGVGTDWHVGEVQEIARRLLGKASLIPNASGIREAFRNATTKAASRSFKDVRLRLWTPQGSRLVFVKQVNPTIEVLTDRAVEVTPQLRDYFTGAWSAGETRDFHIILDVRAGQPGDEMLALRPSVTYEVSSGAAWQTVEDKCPNGRVFANWTDDSSLTSRLDKTVAHYTGQDELAGAIQQGLELRERGEEAAATQLLGRAVQIAHQSGNTDMTQRLSKVVEVVDPSLGTVRLKKRVERADAMELQLESRTTKRVSRKQTEGK